MTTGGHRSRRTPDDVGDVGDAGERPGAAAGGVGRRTWIEGSAALLLAGGCNGTLAGPAVVPVPGPPLDEGAELRRIAFGSCLHQDGPQSILDVIARQAPELFLMLGDNVYADAEDAATLREAYATLGRREEFRRLRAAAPMLATWDDHDYGRNDAGAEYPLRDASQRILLDFFGEPADSPRRRRPGVYHAVTIGPVGRRVQVILLDTRYFRGALRRGPMPNHYARSDDPRDTMLGQEQWAWLAEELRRPAELRLLVSSIQLVAEDHDYERWDEFPHERQRLLALVGETGARGVVVLSGDRHAGELSVLEGSAVGYPLHDLTSSSLNRPIGGTVEGNGHRVGPVVSSANFGAVEVDWEGGVVTLRLYDEHGVARVDRSLLLASLEPAR
jgi:alkaline phosphatase D